MKTISCKQLGGACDQKFHASTFEEIAEMSKKHGMEMFQKGNDAHLQAMNVMRELMKDPQSISKWFEEKRKEFESLPDNNE
jgi:hypothetical protein